MKELNLHKIFCASDNPACFLDHITLKKADDEQLRKARQTIRDYLRQHIGGYEFTLHGVIYTLPNPHFFTQGSFATRTLNAPNHPPRQQADLDDGIYFPLSNILRQEPMLVSNFIIKIIGQLLLRLAEREGWEYVNENPNCDRLIIAPDKHIDLPIYSVPDEEFKRLYESKLSEHNKEYKDFYADDQWQYLPLENVLMAHKDKGWIKSDPRPVVDWCKNQVMLKGEQFRYSVRFSKAWRDEYSWIKDEPKSILLMAAMGIFFKRQIPKRFDLAFYNAIKDFNDYFENGCSYPIPSPADPSINLMDSLDEKGIRQEVKKAINDLYLKLRYAIFECGDPKVACQTMKNVFGHRFPIRPELIVIATVLGTKPKRIEPKQPVGVLTSG